MESPNSNNTPKQSPSSRSFRELVERAKAERAPRVDVRFAVRQALLRGDGTARGSETDWMDVLIGIFAIRPVRFATSASFVVFLITASLLVTSLPPSGTGSATGLTESSDLITSFLLDGTLS